MIWLHPKKLTINGEPVDGVRSVSVSRGAGRSVVEFGDEGPHVVFADVPEQRVEIRIERVLDDGSAVGATVGDTVSVMFETSRGASDAARKLVTLSGVVLSSDIDIDGDKGGRARLRIVGVSNDGSQDPVTIEDVVG